jgi:ABC-type bacteriocin/lantibiotic exporter with double-glycine peptidase domain
MRQGLIERAPALDATARLLALPPHPPRAAEPILLAPDEVRGRIAFEDVSYTPPGAAVPVLDAVRFEIPEGAIVGICGPSGSGKSMLLRLLLRLDDPDAGRILVDGHDLAALDPAALPRLFGVLRQTTQLLQRPIRESLSLGIEQPPDDEDLRRAAAAVQLDELLGGGARSLDTSYRHQPPNLSGGECRRVLLARMLLGDGRICLLDEPEAGLPGATAEAILRTVVEQARGRTHLVVTHAPHLLSSDFNVLLDRGGVVAIGTHQELTERSALYRQLLAEALRETKARD